MNLGNKSMIELESLQSLYSDMYKEAYGFRPRGVIDAYWNNVQWLNDSIKELDEYMQTETYKEEQRRQQEWLDEQEARYNFDMEQERLLRDIENRMGADISDDEVDSYTGHH